MSERVVTEAGCWLRLAEFIQECCTISEDASIMAADLYAGYADWAERRRLRKRDILSNTMFGRRITEKFAKRHVSRGAMYYGIGLRNGQNDGFDGFDP